MTPSPRARAALSPLLLRDLGGAPELASLAILEHALHTTTLALLAVHPTLHHFKAPREPPCVRQARRLLASTAALDRCLRRYRSAVLDALRPCTPHPDDAIF